MNEQTLSHVDVAIVGGGITGLSAAWFLQQQTRSTERDLSYVLLEQSDTWGGKIRTEKVAGSNGDPFLVEGGPDSFITQKPWALQLARQLGLDDQLLPTNDEKRQVYVLNHGRPTPLPDGVLLIVPTQFMPFVRSPLISPLGKLRMGLDLFIPAKRDGEDETLAQFIRRRLGSEALDKIAEPLMSGIYNAEAERQSLLATFPRFRSLEEKHGSLIRGMLASRRARAKSKAQPQRNGKKPPSAFVSLKGGMHTLVEAVRAELTGDCRLQGDVQDIRSQPGGGYRLTLTDGDQVAAQAVILAVPAYVAARLVTDLAPEAATQLAGIRYVSTGTLSLAFRRDEIDHPYEGFGIVIPRSEARAINAITWTSTKFDCRAPQGAVLLRVFFGGSRTPHMMDLDDAELLVRVRSELQAMTGIDADPLFHRIYRWRRANPQYDIGHLARVDAIEAALPDGLFVSGSPYRGIGVPDCVHQAQQTASVVADFLAQPTEEVRQQA